MDCYQKMYYKLFNQITAVINELKTIQIEAEEIMISQKPENEHLHIVSEKES